MAIMVQRISPLRIHTMSFRAQRGISNVIPAQAGIQRGLDGKIMAIITPSWQSWFKTSPPAKSGRIRSRPAPLYSTEIDEIHTVFQAELQLIPVSPYILTPVIVKPVVQKLLSTHALEFNGSILPR